MTQSGSATILGLALLLFLGACRSNQGTAPSSSSMPEQERPDLTGNRAIAPPPSTENSAFLSVGTDRAPHNGPPITTLHIYVGPQDHASMGTLVLSPLEAMPNSPTKSFVLTHGRKGRLFELRIQHVNTTVFQAQILGRNMRLKGSGNDNNWRDDVRPKVTVTNFADSPNVLVTITRDTATMKFVLSYAKAYKWVVQ